MSTPGSKKGACSVGWGASVIGILSQRDERQVRGAGTAIDLFEVDVFPSSPVKRRTAVQRFGQEGPDGVNVALLFGQVLPSPRQGGGARHGRADDVGPRLRGAQ